MKLREFVEKTDEAIQDHFKITGMVTPTFVVQTAAGELMMVPSPPFGKDESAKLMRLIMERLGVTRFVFVDEAWAVNTDNREAAEAAIRKNDSLENFEGRMEIVVYMAEDDTEGGILAKREIIRGEGSAPWGR
jgi:hypothetical protein